MADDNVTQITSKATANDQPKAKAKATKLVTFVSREKEPVAFPVAGYNPTRRFQDMRLVWEVSADDVERFKRHHHVQSNRVIEGK